MDASSSLQGGLTTVDSAGGLENCLKFLKGNSDEQRLVGLLLATKYVQGDDKSSVMQIFNAVGIQFINRLLKSGIQGTTEQEDAYLQLAISVLSAFCRVPELAASDEITEKIPTLVEVLRKRPKDTILADCLECLIGIVSASDQGIFSLKKAGAFSVLLDCLASSTSGSDCFLSSVKLLQMLTSANVLEEEIVESSASILSTIQVLAELLSHEQGSLKLDILLLLQTLCRPEILLQIHAPKEGRWLDVMRNSIGQILRSQCAVEEKFLAMELTKSVVEYTGSVWLLGSMNLPGESKDMPLDRYLADAPSHQRDLSKQFLSLLEYLFTITSDIEESPFLVTQFLLPTICEITREKDGCKAFSSQGGHKQVIAFMLKAIANEGVPSGSVVKSGDIILNVLQKENRLIEHHGAIDFLPLLSVLPSWADSANKCMEISMAASICALILDLTCEEVISQCTSDQVLPRVFNLLLKVLGYLQMRQTSLEENDEEDLWEITLSACMDIVDRYPSFKDAINSSGLTPSILHLKNLSG